VHNCVSIDCCCCRRRHDDVAAVVAVLAATYTHIGDDNGGGSGSGTLRPDHTAVRFQCPTFRFPLYFWSFFGNEFEQEHKERDIGLAIGVLLCVVSAVQILRACSSVVIHKHMVRKHANGVKNTREEEDGHLMRSHQRTSGAIARAVQ